MTLDSATQKIFSLLGAQPTELKAMKVRDIINSVIITEHGIEVAAKRYTIAQMDQLISNYYEVDIKKKTRKREIIQPRQLCMYICRVYLGYYFREIAEHFYTDHTSVIHNVKKVEDMVETGDYQRDELYRILHIAKIPVEEKWKILNSISKKEPERIKPIYSNRSPMGIANEMI